MMDHIYKRPPKLDRIQDYERRIFAKTKNTHLNYYIIYTSSFYDNNNELRVYITENSESKNNSLPNHVHNTMITSPKNICMNLYLSDHHTNHQSTLLPQN